jgi:hypothetical protein
VESDVLNVNMMLLASIHTMVSLIDGNEEDEADEVVIVLNINKYVVNFVSEVIKL